MLNWIWLSICLFCLFSDEGWINRKLRRTVSYSWQEYPSEVISHTLQSPNIGLDLPLQYLVRYSVSRLVLFPNLLHHLMPQTSHPGPRELQPCPEEDLWDEDCTRTDLTQPDNAGVTLADDDTTQKEASAGSCLTQEFFPECGGGTIGGLVSYYLERLTLCGPQEVGL